MTGVGHAFDRGEMVAQWRQLDCDFGARVDGLSVNRPAIAVHFRW